MGGGDTASRAQYHVLKTRSAPDTTEGNRTAHPGMMVRAIVKPEGPTLFSTDVKRLTPALSVTLDSFTTFGPAIWAADATAQSMQRLTTNEARMLLIDKA